jgi:hypothetical protein
MTVAPPLRTSSPQQGTDFLMRYLLHVRNLKTGTVDVLRFATLVDRIEACIRLNAYAYLVVRTED